MATSGVNVCVGSEGGARRAAVWAGVHECWTLCRVVWFVCRERSSSAWSAASAVAMSSCTSKMSIMYRIFILFQVDDRGAELIREACALPGG